MKQLVNTIRLLKEHDRDKLAEYTIKRAYVCNKLKPRFTYIENELNRTFLSEHGFRLDIHATVTI